VRSIDTDRARVVARRATGGALTTFVGGSMRNAVEQRIGAACGLSLAAATLAACASASANRAPGSDLAAIAQPAGGRAREPLARVAGDIEARGDVDTALVLYQHAAATPDPAAQVRLADAYLRAGRPDDALTACRAALAQDQDHAAAMLCLGSALLRSRQLPEAINWLQKAAPRLRTAIAYNRLGVAQTLAGQVDEARASLIAAERLAPNDPDIVTNLALATALAGDGETAVRLMRRVARSPQVEIRHWRNLVTVAGLTGQEGEARSAAHALPREEVDVLLRRAGTIRAVPGASRRGAMLGSIDAAAPPAADSAAAQDLDAADADKVTPAARTTPAVAARGDGFVVQVSAWSNEAAARASFEALQARAPKALAGRQPIIRRADLGERGIVFRTQVGPFATLAEGTRLCDDLKAAGAQCIVQRQ
jgi:Flp pilus assembly protein TadD